MIKRGHPKFNVPNYGAANRSRVKARWRKQRGIDNKKRIKKSFAGAEPNIGYKNPDSLIGVRADGNRIMLVHNQAELQRLIDTKALQGYNVTIAKGVGRRKRLGITQMAQRSGINITNGAYA